MSAIHLDETTLLRSTLGDLPDHRHAAVRKHLARCRACREQRVATKRLHERLGDTGDALAFPIGDPFQARPVPQEAEAPAGAVLNAMAAALARLANERERVRAAIDADAGHAGGTLDLDDPACRLAAAHILEEAIESDPSESLATFASAVEKHGAFSDAHAEAVLPAAQLEALTRLVTGNWHLFCGQPNEAASEFSAAWTALADFGAPEHLVAWAEIGESLRRSYLGRSLEGRLLAERALETFERYGLARGVLRARHAGAVALYTAGKFREAHREFNAVIGLEEATRLDRARAVSGAAFSLAARGQFHQAAKEYSRVRRKLRGEGAQTEQYLLQGDMKVALGTAGRWFWRLDDLPHHVLPEALGAFLAREVSCSIRLLTAIDDDGATAFRLAKTAGAPFGPFTLIYVVQLGHPHVASDPSLYSELARAVARAAEAPGGEPAVWRFVPRNFVLGEAKLLESSASNYGGLSPEAADLAREARRYFSSVGEDPCSLALADFFEASALTFMGNARLSWRQLRAARTTFEAYGLENWSGRVIAATGLVLTRVNHDRAAIRCFDQALRRLDSNRDSSAFTAVLLNLGGALERSGLFDSARATFARGFMLARRHGLTTVLLMIRTCLGVLEASKGNLTKALLSFETLARDASALGAEEYCLGAHLRAALCLVRLGRLKDVREHLEAVRHSRFAATLSCEPDVRAFFETDGVMEVDLFARLAEKFETRGVGKRA